MKKIFILIAVALTTVSSCSKTDNDEYADSKRVTYTFSPGMGGSAQINLYSNREGDYITVERSTLYSYQDEVRAGDKITLVMSKIDEIQGNFDIRVSMDGKVILSNDKVNTNTYPKSIVIDKVLDRSYFIK